MKFLGSSKESTQDNRKYEGVWWDHG